MDFDKYMIPCTNKAITGVECFGCGMQRSIALLLNGDFYGAFAVHPPVYAFLLFGGSLFFFIFNKSKFSQKFVVSSAIFYASFAVISYICKQVINLTLF